MPTVDVLFRLSVHQARGLGLLLDLVEEALHLISLRYDL